MTRDDLIDIICEAPVDAEFTLFEHYPRHTQAYSTSDDLHTWLSKIAAEMAPETMH